MALLLPQMARLPPRLYLAPGRPQAPVRLLPQMHPAPQAAMKRPPEVAAAAGVTLPEDVLDLGEGFLYGVKVRRVGRQVDELTALIFDQLPYSLGLVCSEDVHHHELTRSQGGGQDMLHVGFKDLPDGRSFYDHRRSHPFCMKARQQHGVCPAVSRDFEQRSPAYERVGVEGSQGGMGTLLVHEHQASGVDVADLHAP